MLGPASTAAFTHTEGGVSATSRHPPATPAAQTSAPIMHALIGSPRSRRSTRRARREIDTPHLRPRNLSGAADGLRTKSQCSRGILLGNRRRGIHRRCSLPLPSSRPVRILARKPSSLVLGAAHGRTIERRTRRTHLGRNSRGRGRPRCSGIHLAPATNRTDRRSLRRAYSQTVERAISAAPAYFVETAAATSARCVRWADVIDDPLGDHIGAREVVALKAGRVTSGEHAKYPNPTILGDPDDRPTRVPEADSPVTLTIDGEVSLREIYERLSGELAFPGAAILLSAKTSGLHDLSDPTFAHGLHHK